VNATTSKPSQAANSQKFLTFELGGETYGVEILRVQEIIGIQNVTRVPRMPGFVRGVINLRGRIIPVIDLRTRFGIKETPDTEHTCIVITQINGPSGPLTMGIVIEEVSEVIDIPEGQVESAPELGMGIRTDFLLGMGKLGDAIVILLDIEKVLSHTDLEALDDVHEIDTDKKVD